MSIKAMITPITTGTTVLASSADFTSNFSNPSTSPVSKLIIVPPSPLSKDPFS